MDANPVTLQQNVQRIAQAPLLFAPGSQWLYSLGVDVAGAIVDFVAAGVRPPARAPRKTPARVRKLTKA